MTDIHYIGKDKPQGWYEKEQEAYLRAFLGDKLFEEIDRIEKERRERDN